MMPQITALQPDARHADPFPDDATLATLVRLAAARLIGEDVRDDARREAEMLLEHVLEKGRAWLFSHADEVPAADAASRYASLVARRAQGEPLAYLIGYVGFWTLELAVTPATLIPRPETELLVEAALERLPPDVPQRMADLGTGSGAIALAVASERALVQVVATDASAAALEVAQRNARQHALTNVAFRQGDWLAPLHAERFHLIASNPPYIAEGDPHLARGDLRFEPTAALSSGSDGLDAIRHLVAHAPQYLLPEGWLILEHGHDQGDAVRELLRAAGFSDVETRQDLEQRDRISLGRMA